MVMHCISSSTPNTNDNKPTLCIMTSYYAATTYQLYQLHLLQLAFNLLRYTAVLMELYLYEYCFNGNKNNSKPL